MSADDDQLRPLRERIDALDIKLLALLNERAQCALEVGKVKERQGVGADQETTVFYRPERVAQILRRYLRVLLMCVSVYSYYEMLLL